MSGTAMAWPFGQFPWPVRLGREGVSNTEGCRECGFKEGCDSGHSEGVEWGVPGGGERVRESEEAGVCDAPSSPPPLPLPPRSPFASVVAAEPRRQPTPNLGGV